MTMKQNFDKSRILCLQICKKKKINNSTIKERKILTKKQQQNL